MTHETLLLPVARRGRAGAPVAFLLFAAAVALSVPAARAQQKDDPKVHARAGDAMLGRGSVDSAAVEYQAALALKPKMEEAQLGMARIELTQGKVDEALQRLETYMKKAKRQGPFYAYRGVALTAKAMQWEEKKLQALAADDSAGYFQASAASLPLFQEADVSIRRSQTLEPTNPEFKVMLGDMYMARGVASSAIDAYNAATTLDKNNSIYFYKLGQAYYKDRQYTQAVQAYSQATQIDPSFAAAYEATGEIYFLAERWGEAATAFARYTELKPGDAGAQLMLGESLFKGKFYNDAIPSLRKALEIAPDSCRAGVLLGDAYLFVANSPVRDTLSDSTATRMRSSAEKDSLYSLARQAYLSGVERCGSQSAELYLRVGKLSLTAKDYPAAQSMLEKAVAADTTNAEANFRLGLAYFFQQKYDEAIPVFERTVALDDSNGLAYLNLGLSRYGKSEWPEAVAALVKADSLLPQDNVATRAQALMWAGLAQYRLNDLAAAEATLRRAVEMDPNNPTARKNLDFVIAQKNKPPPKAAPKKPGAGAPKPK